eukprot:m.133780 g.133780  ORF g.133780 m.133780 type:complete len:126 (-) comp17547_c0_seq36:858-1235(-)
MYVHIKKSKDAFEVTSLLLSTVSSSYDAGTELITLEHQDTTLSFKAVEAEDQIRWMKIFTGTQMARLESQYVLVNRTASMPRAPGSGETSHSSQQHSSVASQHAQPNPRLRGIIDPMEPPPPYRP